MKLFLHCLIVTFLVCTVLVCTAYCPPAQAYVDPITLKRTPSGVTRAFDPPAKRWLAGHRGVDLDAPVGATVYAAEDGIVVFAGVVAGTPVVSIDHADGVRTTYQPVYARVSAGDHVSEGSPIGTLGHGHPGLHWGAKLDKDTYINPLSLLEPPRIRLKPVDALGGTPLASARY